ncbi:MAG: nicotinate phosphoribosyltransferase [Actinomycetota bacterium]
MGQALLTDLYELNMAASYFRRGMRAPATFSLFVRELPERWGFFVACGLERCLAFLETLRFTDEDLTYMAETLGYDEETLKAFGDVRFMGDVRAAPEGTPIFPDEPLLEVTAPLPEAQVVETYLLNQITFQTAVASKAARCVLAAPGKDIVDFSFRRDHGAEAALAVARATAIVGFSGTSNVEAARLLNLRATGTMAHSYVEAFESEIDAFRAFAEDHPERVTLLVDTYDSSRGVDNAITVAKELASRGERLMAVRLDSGDLDSLARDARKRLDEAGLSEVKILASGGIDEDVIAAVADSPIDAFGVGSKVGVAAGAPYLDSVYKLVSYDGRPVAKLSARKATLPGPKQVWRRSRMAGDVIATLDEEGPQNAEPLLVSVMENGRRVRADDLDGARNRFRTSLEALPGTLRSVDAGSYPVERSGALEHLARQVRAEIRERELS